MYLALPSKNKVRLAILNCFYVILGFLNIAFPLSSMDCYFLSDLIFLIKLVQKYQNQLKGKESLVSDHREACKHVGLAECAY